MIAQFDISHKKGNLNFNYKAEINNGITGIFGPSGSGKTTLLNLLSGIEKPHDGSISINAKEIYNQWKKIIIPVHKRKTGYVFQDARLFPHLTVEQNLYFGKKYSNPELDSQYLEKVIRILELQEILKHKPWQLSGGQQQRVAIGRTLFTCPNILLLDEPFSSLDRTLRKQIITYLLRVNRHIGTPMLVVSHDLEDLLRLSPDLILINEGSIIAHDSYFNLCMDENFSGYIEANELLNVVDARVVKHKENQNLVFLETNKDMGNLIIIQTGSKNGSIEMGGMVRVGIKPEDVALSSDRIENISIQNQWEGIVKKIINREDGVFCHIDCGFDLIAQLTVSSKERLKIEEGKKIFCLVKSKGIEMIHVYSNNANNSI